jgi:glycine/D-amino acid oxidase-like deaminating enzyme
VVVNAAGPRAASVAAMAGLDLPVVAVKATSFAFKAESPIADCPIILDRVLAMQLKPEGELYVCAAPGGAMAAGPDDFDVDMDLFEQEVWPRVAARVPQFERLRLARGWVGHVEWNRLDGNPVLGRHPERDNLYFITGFSGHGVQHAPAAGRAIAELILHGEYRSLDLARFGYERVIRGEPYPETV